MMRRAATIRDVRAGCFVCHGDEAHWMHAGAQGTAAQHHDATGHATWADVYQSTRYGIEAADPRQVDLEEAIAAAPGAERQPEATPHPVPDAPAVRPAGVSAHEGRPSRRPADRPDGARGRKPETASP